MHSTLKAETAKPPRSSFRAQQRTFDKFKHEYNEIRPHEALGQTVPAATYKPSLLCYPKKLPEPEYPDHFEVTRAYPNGVISFAGIQWYLCTALQGEWIGLEPLPGNCWKVFFAHVEIGIADVQNGKKRGHRNFGHLVPMGRDEAWWHSRPRRK